MNESSYPALDLPEDVLLSVRGISKKFCGDIHIGMRYGLADLASEWFGKRNQPVILRDREFWALKDVSFDIRRGEAVGLIGVNGGGKSTLCRLIADILPPDEGEIHIRGKVGALIQLGVGFHPHLTGRENVFLNGALLGMSRARIRERLDDILDFAGLGDFIDSPVATYSSGMTARLGFSIAAHAEVDLLVVDETLSVGDVAFRNKCLQYMQRTVSERHALLFVSHNMTQLNAICDRVILLHEGRILADGDVDEVVALYLKRAGRTLLQGIGGTVGADGLPLHEFQDGRVLLRAGRMIGADDAPCETIDFGQSVGFEVEIETRVLLDIPLFSIWFMDFVTRQRIAFARAHLDRALSEGRWRIRFQIPSFHLQPGVYLLGCGVGNLATHEKLAVSNDLLRFSVAPLPSIAPKSVGLGYVRIQGEWQCQDAMGQPLSDSSFLPFGEVDQADSPASGTKR